MERKAYCQGKPLEVGTEPVLLLDDAYVEDRWGVQRYLNVPHKCPQNPLILADQPWEDRVVQPSVLYDDQAGLFRMWYTVLDQSAWRHQFQLKDWSYEKHGMPYFPCYAESRDGIHWDKPLLDDKPYQKFSKTNIVMTGHQKIQGTRVTWNHPSTGQKGRFMMTYKDNLPKAWSSLCLAYSDDGIHWRPDPANPIKTGVRDTRHNIVFDEKRQRWLLFTRPMCFAGVVGIPGGPTGQNFKRRVAVAVGKTPQSFDFPRNVIWPDEHDQPDFDNMTVERLGNHFLGFLTQMGPPPKKETRVHLAFSHDGLHWQQLPERTPLIGRGSEDDFDAGQASNAGNIVTVKDKTYLYYSGARRGQDSWDNLHGIGRVEMHRERFVAQMGHCDGGFLLTREVVVAAEELVVNMTLANGYNTAPELSLRTPAFAAEILAFPQDGASPKPVAGYTLAECTAVPTEMIEYTITWKEKQDLSELVGKPVFIRFYLKNVGLYSFRFRETAE